MRPPCYFDAENRSEDCIRGRRAAPGHEYVAAIALGRDVAVVTWDNDLLVYRLPAG